MGIRIERLKDFAHLKEGDFVFFPAEEPDRRRTRLAASSLSKLGLSVGSTGRSDNMREDLDKVIHDMCSVPMMFRIRECHEKRVWIGQRAMLLRNAAAAAGPEHRKYDVTLANLSLDPRLSRRKDNRNVLVGAHVFEDAILRELAATLDPRMIVTVRSDVDTSDLCFRRLGIYLHSTVIDDEKLAPGELADVIAGNRRFTEDDAEAVAYDKFVFRYDGIKFVFPTRFIAEMAKRGAVVFRATGLDENVARRAVHEIYMQCSEHHAKNADAVLSLAKRLIVEASTMTRASRGFKTLARRAVGPRKSELADIDRMLRELARKDSK